MSRLGRIWIWILELDLGVQTSLHSTAILQARSWNPEQTFKRDPLICQTMALESEESYNEQIIKRDKSSVNGYIREIEAKSFSNNSFYRTIPICINHLCLKYCHESKDRFHPILHGKDVEIINKEVHTRSRGYCSAFLSNIVSKGIHKWRFQQISGNNQYIGICDNSLPLKDDRYLNDWYHWKAPLASFGLCLITGYLRGKQELQHKWGKYCPITKKGDIIELCLDLNKMELKYIINGKDYGKAFDIPPGQYRVGVCLAYRHSSCKLLQYDTKLN